MIVHIAINNEELRGKIRRGEILFGGNRRDKIYGALRCTQGKRLRRANRVFFTSEAEALSAGFRPCGHCQRAAYKLWKALQ